MSLPRFAAAALAALLLAGCAGTATNPAPEAHPGGATEATRAHQAGVARAYDLREGDAMADARRGLIAAPTGQIKAADGRVVWDFGSFGFVQGTAPDTVNPSLWRQARLNNQAGLFKVSEGIWQLRGFDLANLTLIEGRTGWIVVDPLTVRATAAAAMAFARQHLGERPVTAMIFTHSHVDHFGGALGVLSAQEVKARGIPVVAPAGFMEEATSENLMAGTAMGRRAAYMYGAGLPRRATGLVDNGLGKATAQGRIGILAPTVLIDQPRQELVLDGVRFVFHNVPGAEAPAELVFSLPERKAFAGAEIVSQTLHNLYTLRGAKVRDALQWAAHIDAMIEQLGDAEVLFNQHHWPVWGRARIVEFLKAQRDTYRYIHDQTVRGMNRGLTAGEIAETLRLPRSLDAQLAVHGYYGTVRHNVRAVYQHYLGWFDAHPANLDPLPPVAAAQRYVALAGGAPAAVAQAQRAFDQGDYRWSAELLRHVVLADAGNRAARELQARAFEQLGYQAESSAWRNFYLVGARELREGPPPPRQGGGAMADMLPHVPTQRLLETMAAYLDGPAADGLAIAVNLSLTDADERWGLWLENAVLHHRRGTAPGSAQVSLAMPRAAFLRLMSGSARPADVLAAPGVRVEGDAQALHRLLGLLARGGGSFPIVTR
ncbi:MBL fold metallo-hydrolase [Xenophilus arseniciresistens]|uniref:MBL fold metallo-hydrolase n=1 Tax=Xenophilus arseniciresistens TaxID=1283306 RepID=A0AAE3NAD8_9BURK|nr:alkyl sulfatase dimerization domain-containing protein [Xenophilus arseniciresistens]MDA7419055.1 MBL fold metallo-hydrolase [Xenophilus arseniciresistens]